jgi:type II secretory pathway pseudopilin PulG
MDVTIAVLAVVMVVAIAAVVAVLVFPGMKRRREDRRGQRAADAAMRQRLSEFDRRGDDGSHR